MKISPDVEQVIEAINEIKGASIVPEDIDEMVFQTLKD